MRLRRCALLRALRAMKTKKHPSDLSAVDLIKYLNGRRGWHGKQYRSLCGAWLRKAEIRKQALAELANDIPSTNDRGMLTPKPNREDHE